jgi:hypothetical protein
MRDGGLRTVDWRQWTGDAGLWTSDLGLHRGQRHSPALQASNAASEIVAGTLIRRSAMVSA